MISNTKLPTIRKSTTRARFLSTFMAFRSSPIPCLITKLFIIFFKVLNMVSPFEILFLSYHMPIKENDITS
jgi:hypothetical protein